MIREIDVLIRHVANEAARTGRIDLDAVEMATRAAMHQTGAKILAELLRPGSSQEESVPCSCGQRAKYRGMRRRGVLTVVGPVQIDRAYFLCDHCHQGQCPRDAQLDVVDAAFSPGVRRMMAVVGSESPFEQGRVQLDLLAGLTVTTKAVERHAEAIGSDIAGRGQKEISRVMESPKVPSVPCPARVLYVEMDGTGLPVVPSETEGRVGKVDGERAHTREAKVGCVFTQTTINSKGRPMRDACSTTYTGAIETAEEFGRRIYAEAYGRGCEAARKIVVIGDGAPWIWNLADEHFPRAIQIVDLFHARQHIWDLSAKLFTTNRSQSRPWAKMMVKKLNRGQVVSLVKDLKTLKPKNPDVAESVRVEAEYFQRNAFRMRYPTFKRQKFFVGSGVVEAACKSILGSRLKRSGMFWTVRGANAIIALRATRHSGRFEDYWESRSTAA